LARPGRQRLAFPCSTNRFSILPFEKRFSVEPYGIAFRKDHPLSPSARTLPAAVRSAVPRPAHFAAK
jgi:hypothetical protein